MISWNMGSFWVISNLHQLPPWKVQGVSPTLLLQQLHGSLSLVMKNMRVPHLGKRGFPIDDPLLSFLMALLPNAVSIFVDPTSKVVGPSSSMSSEKRSSFELLVVVVVGQKAPFIPQGLCLDNADFWWVSVCRRIWNATFPIQTAINCGILHV